MLIPLFYTLNTLLLLSGLLVFRPATGERRFSLSLIQVLLGLPLLAGEYGTLAPHLEGQAVHLVLFSEYVFALLWFFMAFRLRRVTVAAANASHLHFFLEILIATLLTGTAVYFLVFGPVAERSDAILVFPDYGPVYFLAIFSLLAGFYAAWRLEAFWRGLDVARRREYKTLVVGSFLACGAMVWAASYRLTFLDIVPEHLRLLAVLFLLAWALMVYGVTGYRLLNRKIYISRKVIYSSVAPSLFGIYLLCFGMVFLVMRFFGLSLPFILKWLLVSLGLVCAGLYVCSGRLRRRVHFFVSTHFYANKYEYRDEWLALSRRLQGAMSEAEVVQALEQVLAESLYTNDVFIWLGDSSRGYRLVSLPENADPEKRQDAIAPENSLIGFFTTHSHFHLEEKEPDLAWKIAAEMNQPLLSGRNLVLLSPISIGNQLLGLIGLGPEFTGAHYGHDDFDLLTALGNHTAAALLAVRMADELAHAREQQAWDRLSAFVLHDIKNAATMLSLLRENTPEHIHEPAFQEDMLEVVNDALRRMGRVEQRLGTLKDEVTPVRRDLELGPFLEDCTRGLGRKLTSMEITIDCRDKIEISTDPELLFSILENLLLNAFEAQGEGSVARIRTGRDDKTGQVVIEVIDNGPGIAEELLPDLLFEPFKTMKDGGSGIGLWHVKRLVTALGGSVSAENRAEGGARFVIRLPLAGGVG
jgi:putative PEP-CTERM system histidine kinase